MAEQPRGNDAELSRIDSLIARTRRMLRSAWVLTGAGLSVGLCLAAITVTSLADLVVPLPIKFRFLAFLAVVVPTVLALIAGVVRPAARPLSDHHIARRVERLLPNIQSRLVTTLDLAHDGVQPPQSSAYFRALVAETADRVGRFQPASVVNLKNLRQSAIFAAGAVFVFIVALVAFHDRLPTAISRVVRPFADIPPATGVRFTAEPGDAKSLKGDDVTIAAVLERGDTKAIELEFRPGGGTWRRAPMPRTAADRFEVTLAQLDASIEYRLVGGRTWTRRNRIEVIDRPQITGLHTVVRYPPYMKVREPVLGSPQVSDAAAPIGSDVEVVVDVAGQAVSGEIQILDPVTKMLAVTDRRERVWFENKIPEGARQDGNWVWDYALKFRAAHTEPPAAGPHSHGFQAAHAGFAIQPGDYIFTYVFVVPEHAPDEIMLQFNDGKDWEHRAFWGSDKIAAGAPNTAARARIGELPRAGDWVRLEVPAKSVGLEGKKITGVSFTLFGGQCKWFRVGAIDPPEQPERSFLVNSTISMNRVDRDANAGAATQRARSSESADRQVDRSRSASSTWSGSVPLTRDSFYRVEFKNELGHSSKEMREGKLTAIPDNPPWVMLERPGENLVLSEPQKLPLVLLAEDDFGLADVSLAVQKGDSGGFIGASIKSYEGMTRYDAIVFPLDLEPHQLKPGEFIRYRVQARDQKGQIAETQEFEVRIRNAADAADRQLAAIGQQLDALDEKLGKLIDQQAAITESVAKLAAESRPAEIDREKKQSERRQALAKLAEPQDTAVQLAAQLQGELNQAATRLADSKLVPAPIAALWRAAEQMFQDQAIQPMRGLVQSLREAGDAQKPDPDVNSLTDSAARIQQQLEAMKSRLQSLARAQQNMKADPAAALAQLRQDLMQQNANRSARELAESRDFLDRLISQVNMLEGRESELARQTQSAMPVVLPGIEREQDVIETDAEKLLAQVERLMAAENLIDKNRRSIMSDGPETPRPEIQPPAEAALNKDHAKMADDDDLFAPPTGVKQKIDPRFANKARTARNSAAAEPAHESPNHRSPQLSRSTHPKDQSPHADDLRRRLHQRQQQTAQQLDAAQQQLQSPRDRLAQVLQQLREAVGLESDEAANELAQLMQSMDMQQAIQLARAMRQAHASARTQSPAQWQTATNPPQPSSATELNAALSFGTIESFDSNDIDPAARTVILRMQPRLREELLKGMREEGPEAYRKFIQDYFNRLTKLKTPP